MAGFKNINWKNVGGSALGLAGAMAGAYYNRPRRSQVDYTGLASMNRGYKPSSMEGLMSQFNNTPYVQSLTSKDLYDPSTSDTFRSGLGAGLSVYGASKGLTDNFKGLDFNGGKSQVTGDIQYSGGEGQVTGDIQYSGGGAMEDTDFSQLISQNGQEGIINPLVADTSNLKFTYPKACGGHLHGCGGRKYLDGGDMLMTGINLSNALLGVGLNAAGMKEERDFASADASKFNFNRQYLTDRLAHDRETALYDSKNNMFNMQAAQMKAHGGDLHTQGADFPLPGGYNFIGNGGSHEQNYLGGVPQGIASDGIPNLVEQDEVVWNDYVFSRRLRVPGAIRSKYKLSEKLSFADAAEKLITEAKERPNDPISQNGIEAKLSDLRDSQEDVRMRRQANQIKKQLAGMSPEELMQIQALLQQQQGQPMPIEAAAQQPMMAAYGGHKFEDGGTKDEDANKKLFTRHIAQWTDNELREVAKDLQDYDAAKYPSKQSLIDFLTEKYDTLGGYDGIRDARNRRMVYDALTTLPEYQITEGTTYSMTPEQWAQFFAGMDAYGKSKIEGKTSGNYRIDPNFIYRGRKVGTGLRDDEDVEKDPVYIAFKQYVKDQAKKYIAGDEDYDKNAIAYLQRLDANVSPSTKKLLTAEKGENGRIKFSDTWEEDYSRRNFDQKGGIYHYYADTPDIQKIRTGNRVVVRQKVGNEYRNLNVPLEQIQQNPFFRYLTSSTVDDGNGMSTTYYDFTAPEYTESYTPVEEDGTVRAARNYPTWMRYAPLAGPLLADYTARDYSTFIPPREVTFTPIGDYLPYNPVDSQRYLTAIAQQDAARRSAIQNMSGANRNMAMAQDALAEYQRQQDIANVLNTAEGINFDRRAKVGNFNRGTNMFNAQAFNQSEFANSKIPVFMFHQAANNARMRKAVDDAIDEAKSVTYSTALENLHNIGNENFAFNQANNNPALWYGTDRLGDIRYKRITKDGGMLTKKRKGRR